jgi:hypothetical protein
VWRFQATTVSRWLVMPMAATLSAPTWPITSSIVVFTTSQISRASCSTQPGSGKCWVNSRYDATTGRPAAMPPRCTALVRTPVVPASMATTQRADGSALTRPR